MLRLILLLVAVAVIIGFSATEVRAGSSDSPTVIVQLGAAPLLGRSDSTQALRAKMNRNEARLSTAATMLGLTLQEYRAFRASLATKTPGWGVLPRHLEVMAFYRSDGVHVLQNVIIPARTYGWEVDVDEGDQTLRVLIPASCGNLSVLRQFHPAVAARVVPPPSRVAASVEQATPSPAPAAAAAAVPTPIPSTSPSEQSPAPAPAATPSTTVAITPPQTTTTHRFRWPWLIAVVILLFHGVGGSSSSYPPPPVCGCGCH